MKKIQNLPKHVFKKKEPRTIRTFQSVGYGSSLNRIGSFKNSSHVFCASASTNEVVRTRNAPTSWDVLKRGGDGEDEFINILWGR
jgi:hypothetical protein